MKKFAIFDIDGTIFRSSLLIELVEEFIHEDIFPLEVRAIYLRSYQNWANRKGTYEKYINDVVKVFNKYLYGVSYLDFQRVSKNVVAMNKNKVYRFTRDLVKNLKKKKYFLLAISHSPKGIVDDFCDNFGFDKVYGMMYKINKNKKFIGGTLFETIIKNKEKILKRAIRKENLTIKNSVGVGDTESDISFLKMVSRPICFNPNKKLYNYAKKNNWEIIVERKDVIYRVYV